MLKNITKLMKGNDLPITFRKHTSKSIFSLYTGSFLSNQ